MIRKDSTDEETPKNIIIHRGETETGEKFVRKYKKGEYLGKGGFAQCFIFTCQETNKQLAGKIIDKNSLCKSRTMKKLLYEISIHKSLKHDNIVEFLDFFEDKNNVYIVLELCENGNLNEYFKESGKRKKSIKEGQIREYTRQLIKALKYCHDRNIIHRDLKLGNLLLKDDYKTIVLADFGLSAKLEYTKQRRRTICGTPNYIAPEIISSRTTHSFEVDVWSLGIIIYILMVGSAPFSSKNIKETYRKIRCVDFKIPYTANVSPEASDLLKHMLEKDSSKRATLEELNIHPFITDNGRLLPPLEDGKIASSKSYVTAKPGYSGINKPLASSDSVVSTQISKQSSKIWVSKCCDYTKKYGLGYLLTNGQVGIFFNDKSKFLLSPRLNKLLSISISEEGEESTVTYNLSKIPTGLKKKYRLLESFTNYLMKNASSKYFDSAALESNTYVKYWIRSKNAFAFRFSNKTMQVLFNDNTEIRMISKPEKLVIYVSPKGEYFEHKLEDALNSEDSVFLKRLEYARRIVKELVSR